MSIVSTIGIKLTAEGGEQVDRELKVVTKGVKETESASEKLGQAITRVKGIIAGYIGIQTVRQFVETADAMTAINARLKLATTSTTEFAQAQSDVYRISQTNNVSLRETADVYARLGDPIRKLGGSSREVAGIVEALSASLRISGTTGAAASGAITQFAQAMASGTLRGDEFNSVNEQAPRLMQALESALGQTRGELRKMAEQGLLTSDVVGNALITSLSQLKAEAATLPDTVGGAFTRLQNDLAVFVAGVDQSTGTTAALAGVLSGMAALVQQFGNAFKSAGDNARDSAGSLDYVGLTIAAVGKVFETVVVLGANVAYVLKSIGLEIGGLAAQAAALVSGDFSQIGAIHRQMQADADANRAAIDKFSASILGSTDKVLAQRDALQAGAISASEAGAEMAKLARQSGEAAGATLQQTKSITAQTTEQKAAAAAAAKHAEEQRKLSVIISDYGTPAMEQSNAETARLKRQNESLAETMRGAVAPALDETTAETARLARQNKMLADSYEGTAEAARKSAEEAERRNEEIGRSLTDALFRAFESGKGFAQAFKDTLVNAFKTMILQPTIKAIVSPVAASIGSFMPGSASAAGGDALGGLSSLGGIGGNLASLIGGASSLGTIFGTGATLGLTGGFGAAMGSAGAMASAGMYGSAAAMGLGAVAPYALAAYAIYDALKYTPTPHVGSAVGINSAGMASTLWGQSDILNNYSAETDAALRALGGSTVAQLNRLGALFGGSANFSASTAFAADGKDASIGKFLLSRGGAQLAGGVQRDNGNYKLYGSDGQAAFNDFLKDVAGATISALDSIDLPEWARNLFSQLGSEADLESLQAVFDAVASTSAAITDLGNNLRPIGGIFADIADLSSDAAIELAGMVGGIDALRTKTAQYVATYYSEDEQAALSARRIFADLAATGLNLGGLNSTAKFRQLLESRDVTTEQGRTQFAALLNASSAFADLAQYLGQNGLTLYQLSQAAPAAATLEQMIAGASAGAASNDAVATGMSNVSTAVTESNAGVIAAIDAMKAEIMELRTTAEAIASAAASTARQLAAWDDGGTLSTTVAT